MIEMLFFATSVPAAEAAGTNPLPPPSPVALESIVAFDDPRKCVEASSLKNLTEGMLSFDESTRSVRPGPSVSLPGVGLIQPVVTEVSTDWIRTMLPVTGAWHGLHLLRIETTTGIESGPSNLHLVFAEPAERALPVLNRLGFDLPPPGQNRVIADEVIDVRIGLHPDGGGSTLSCFVD